MKKTNINNKDLLYFIKSSKYHIKMMDKIMVEKESFERGSLIAKEMNRFNLDLDKFLHFNCDISMGDLNKVLNKTFKLK